MGDTKEVGGIASAEPHFRKVMCSFGRNIVRVRACLNRLVHRRRRAPASWTFGNGCQLFLLPHDEFGELELSLASRPLEGGLLVVNPTVAVSSDVDA